MGSWNPWRALRHLEHVLLTRIPLAPTNGLIATTPSADAALIVLDDELGRRDRNAVLAHELVHLERGVLPADAPRHLVDREERAVEAEVARRLVDPDLWAALGRRIDPVMPWEAADELDVPEAIVWRRRILDDAFPDLAEPEGDERLRDAS